MTGRQAEGMPRCAAWMPLAKETCARAVGHRDSHRTRYALDNAYRTAFGREPDPWAFRDGKWVPR